MKRWYLAPLFCILFLTASAEAQENHEGQENAKAAVNKSFDGNAEVREFPLGKVELLEVDGVTIGRATFQPGWRWSTSLKETTGTQSCEAPHFQYVISGVLHIKMDDGSEFDLKPGDVSMLPSGHDAWVVGDEPVVVVDWHGMVNYAK
jgi:uncharacterized cupin superfamily protein